MRNTILVVLLVAACLLTAFASLFAIKVFSRGPTGFEAMVSIVALIAAVTALLAALSGYRRLKRPGPPP